MLKICSSLCLLAAFCLPHPVSADPAEPVGRGGQGKDCAAPSAPRLHAWMQTLTPPQRLAAQAILDEYSPQVTELRQRIALKKRELEQLNYDQATPPETLPRLGRELQELRDALRALLLHADQRMRTEAGIPLGRPASRGCRMECPQLTPAATP